MPRTDDGEFELVLGNKQLLSVFFIMVVLLGVFFAMGYIAGRNSGPGASDAAKKADAAKPIVVDNSQRTSPMPDAGTPASQPAQQPAADSAGTSTQPVAGTQAPPQAEHTPAEPPAAATKLALPAQTGDAPAVAEPAAGLYLQVSAAGPREEEVVAETLSKRGFKTQLAPGPNAATVRVLVGPLKDASEAASTKADLEKAGFKPFVKRY